VLYTVDVGKQPVDDVLSEAQVAHGLDEKSVLFARNLVMGTLQHQKELDTVLDRIATGFPTERQTAVDRNILRLAACEILFAVSDAPPGAVVNEAVELAKKYSTNESGRFVNGVLGTLVREYAQARLAEGDSEDSEIVFGLPGVNLLVLPKGTEIDAILQEQSTAGKSTTEEQ
jgi:N utilization substance protein B